LGHGANAALLKMGRIKDAGQSLTELAICVIVISSAFIAIQLYVQRGLQARYKGGTDFCLTTIKQQAGALRYQYDPYYETSRYKESNTSNVLKGFPNKSTNETTIKPGGTDNPGSTDLQDAYGWKHIGTVADAD
jgi:hypothetical protein